MALMDPPLQYNVWCTRGWVFTGSSACKRAAACKIAFIFKMKNFLNFFVTKISLSHMSHTKDCDFYI